MIKKCKVMQKDMEIVVLLYALCSTGTTDLQEGVALSQNTSLNLSINRLQVFRSLYFIDQWRKKSTIAQCLKIFKKVSSLYNFANVCFQSYFFRLEMRLLCDFYTLSISWEMSFRTRIERFYFTGEWADLRLGSVPLCLSSL